MSRVETRGFKIECLDCNRIVELKEIDNEIFKMKQITVSPVENEVDIECECGNFVHCYWD